MNIHHPPNWLRRLYFSFQWKMRNEANTIFLTFDDGPTPEVTEWVLDQLETYQAKATFFCIGRNVERHPEIYRKIIEKGHAVGNHTYSHLNGWKTWNDEYIQDIELAADLIHSKLFRPPYGRIRHHQIKNLKRYGYKLFMWDVLSEDYNAENTPGECLNYVTAYSTPGSIVVFHDSLKASKNLYATLPAVLKYFKEKGFEFRKLK
ncbi:MAG: polysaccharide deacetylase family protein [Salinivirgaceae bacterium]|nr:polysaccharide deacetylase family protein [Salinivirgaceae bacterium]